MKQTSVACIYRIDFLGTGWFYIGSTFCHRSRFSKHKYLLSQNKHENPKMQNVYNKYKLEPTYKIIEFCARENLKDRENFWFFILEPNLNIIKDSYQSIKSLNIPYVGEEIEFENLESKEIVIVKKEDLENFIRKNTPNTTNNYNRFYKLLKGEAYKVFGWTIKSIDSKKRDTPSNQERYLKSLANSNRKLAEWIRLKRYIVTSPEGVKVCLYGLKTFADNHNLSYSCLGRVANGQMKSHRGWLVEKISKNGRN